MKALRQTHSPSAFPSCCLEAADTQCRQRSAGAQGCPWGVSAPLATAQVPPPWSTAGFLYHLWCWASPSVGMGTQGAPSPPQGPRTLVPHKARVGCCAVQNRDVSHRNTQNKSPPGERGKKEEEREKDASQKLSEGTPGGGPSSLPGTSPHSSPERWELWTEGRPGPADNLSISPS